MKERPLRTTVVGSYPFPCWIEFARQNISAFGDADLSEIQEDAVITAIYDQISSGLEVITDGEQTRLDFNLSFYGYLEGIEREDYIPRHFGPPAHDQRGKYRVNGEIKAPRGLGVVEEFKRLKSLSKGITPQSTTLKACIPGPYTLSGRLIPNNLYRDRYALTEALIPIVRTELESLVGEGCGEITLDEPSMSCYAHREDKKRLVELFNLTVRPIFGRCRLGAHLCFGNFKGRAIGPRKYEAMFPDFLDLNVDEIHLEMANREFSEIEIINQISRVKDVAVGIIDVKNYYIETVEDVASRVRLCLKYASPDRLSLAPDCGFSQTARWAAKAKLKNLVDGVRLVKKELGIEQGSIFIKNRE